MSFLQISQGITYDEVCRSSWISYHHIYWHPWRICWSEIWRAWPGKWKYLSFSFLRTCCKQPCSNWFHCFRGKQLHKIWGQCLVLGFQSSLLSLGKVDLVVHSQLAVQTKCSCWKILCFTWQGYPFGILSSIYMIN